MWSSTPSRAEPEPVHKDGTMQFAPVHLVDVVSTVVQQLDTGGDRVQVVIERAPAVLADFDKLTDVLTTLLTNALDSTPEEAQIEVAVSSRCLEPEPSDSTTTACPAAVSVSIRNTVISGRRATSAPAPLAVAGADHILRRHDGRLWAATRDDEKTLGFCLGTGQAA